jgi:hypothetical protein
MSLRYLGTIVATTTKNNSDTASPFTIPAAAKIAVQPDAACYVKVGTESSVTATSTAAKVEANAIYYEATPSTHHGSGAYVAALSVSGTANVKVYERAGNEG